MTYIITGDHLSRALELLRELLRDLLLEILALSPELVPKLPMDHWRNTRARDCVVIRRLKIAISFPFSEDDSIRCIFFRPTEGNTLRL